MLFGRTGFLPRGPERPLDPAPGPDAQEKRRYAKSPGPRPANDVQNPHIRPFGAILAGTSERGWVLRTLESRGCEIEE